MDKFQEKKPNWKAKRRQLRYYDYKQRLKDYLITHPCVDCGNTDIRVLEFDHVRGIKKMAVSKLLINGYSWKHIEAEIAKCDIRCANCHKIRHDEKGWHI